MHVLHCQLNNKAGSYHILIDAKTALFIYQLILFLILTNVVNINECKIQLKTSLHKYWQQTVGYHRERGLGMREIGEEDKGVQTANCKIS